MTFYVNFSCYVYSMFNAIQLKSVSQKLYMAELDILVVYLYMYNTVCCN